MSMIKMSMIEKILLFYKRRGILFTVLVILYVLFVIFFVLYLPAQRKIRKLEIQVAEFKVLLAKGREGLLRPLIPSPFKPLELVTEKFLSLPADQRTLVRELNEFAKYSLLNGDYGKAIEKLDQSLGIAPSPEALYYKGVAFYGNRNFSVAIESWKQILDMDLNQDAKKHVALYIGFAYYQMDEFEHATPYFKTYIQSYESRQ